MPEYEEIERTWLVIQDKVPTSIFEDGGDAIDQGYITPINNDNPLTTTYRLRKRKDAYFFTWKQGGPILRIEYEVHLTQEQFQVMWNMVGDQKLEKVRYVRKVYDERNPELSEGYLIELDQFGGELEGLMLVEVEFDSEEAARRFVAPDWFGMDVTDDSRFSNYSLAVNGLPDPGVT